MQGAFYSHLPEEPLVSLYFVKRLLCRHFFAFLEATPGRGSERFRPTKDDFTDQVDQRALALWERNLQLIAELCKKQGVRPMFVPQIMNWKALLGDGCYGWFPYVRDRDIKKIMEAYHRSMEKVASQEGLPYVAQMLEAPFSESDFVDNGHFSPEGNRRFAAVLAKHIKAE